MITYPVGYIDFSALTHYQLSAYEANAFHGPMDIAATSDVALVASPMNGIAQYTDGMSCSWMITVPEGQVCVFSCY